MKKVNHRWMRICSMLLVLTLLGNDCIGSTGIVFGAQLDQGIEDSLIDGESVDDNNVGDNGGESGEGERTEYPDMKSSDDTGLTDNPDDTDIPEDPLDNNPEDMVQDAETEDTVDEEISEFLLDDEEQTVLIAEEDISQRSSNIRHMVWNRYRMVTGSCFGTGKEKMFLRLMHRLSMMRMANFPQMYL